MTRGSWPTGRLAVVCVAGVILVTTSAFLGPQPVSWNEVTDPDSSRFFWPLRLPRTILAAFVGAGLSLGGVVFQTLFRNPLATPYTLGIASGASVAVTFGMMIGAARTGTAFPSLYLFALAGSCGAVGLILLLARLPAGRDMNRLLLGGVCIGYASAAGVMLMQSLGTPALAVESVKWMMGSLAFSRPYAGLEVAVAWVCCLALVTGLHRSLDQVAMGDALAAGRGVNVGAVTWTCLAACGVLTAVIVANCGPIGFVGLMIPNVLRYFIGARTLPLVLASCFFGAAFLALCDGAARSFRYEIPVGVITNLLGSMFFFASLLRRSAQAAQGTM